MNRVSRRRFMQGVATVAGATFVGPYILRAGMPSKKLLFAYIGTGGRGGSHLGMGEAVAWCDVDRSRWPKGKDGQPRWPNAVGYTDYRKMLEKHEKDIDCVVVATPDHHHYPAAMLALKMNKHVYCEKPLTWSVNEARALAEETAKRRLATQMGNQGHANNGNRRVVEWIRAGAIGDVKEVHTWTNRPIWPQGIQQRPPSKPAPENLDWDCWIGPAPYRDYHDGLHPFAWRGWFDFGCGAIGDMGCHTWDCVFWAMDPDYPTTVELVKIVGKSSETWPKQSIVKWEYPAKGNRPAFTAYWYEGGLKPPVPEEILNDPSRTKKQLAGSGSLFIGTKGKLYVEGDYGDSPRLIPESFMKEWQSQPKDEEYQKKYVIPPSQGGHAGEWLAACRGEKPWDFPGSNFAKYAGPLTENMLLGGIAIRLGEEGKKFQCDPVARKILTPEAAALAGREPRAGWKF